MYPYPYPAYPAYPMPVYRPPPPKTPEGVKWSLVGLFLGLGYFVALMVVAALYYNELANADPTDIFGFISSFLWTAVAGILTGVIGLMTLIFYFIGFGYLYAGRNEFGPTHARNLQFSFVLAIVALVMYVVAAIVSFIASLSIFSGTGGTITVDTGALYLSAALRIVMGLVVSAIVAAHLVLAIRSLVRPERQTMLNVAVALGTATPGIAGALTLLQMPAYISLIEAWASGVTGGIFTTPPIGPESGLPSIMSAVLTVVTILLFIVLYREIALRLRAGELKPILPTPPPAPSWMPGPVVPPPPYAPYAPYAPPAQPPQAPPPGPQGPPP
jgi:hypothetical protein